MYVFQSLDATQLLQLAQYSQRNVLLKGNQKIGFISSESIIKGSLESEWTESVGLMAPGESGAMSAL